MMSANLDNDERKLLMRKTAREMIDYLSLKKIHFYGDYKYSYKLEDVPDPIKKINQAISYLESLEDMIPDLEFALPLRLS